MSDNLWITSSYSRNAERMLLDNLRITEEDDEVANWRYTYPIGSLAEGDVTIQYGSHTILLDAMEQLRSEYQKPTLDYGVSASQFISSLNNAWASVDENWEPREEAECSKEDPISYDDLMAEFDG